MQYYVYALIDPRDNRPFYIGKGKDKRLKKHFIDAKSYEEELTLIDVSDEEQKELNKFDNVEKFAMILELHKEGYKFEDIARILAKDLDEESAFTLEAFLIKTIYGFDNLANRVVGKYSDRFRPNNSWDALKGHDVLLVSDDEKGVRVAKLNAMIAEKLDRPLMEIINAFPELVFDKPKVLDAGEIGIEADIEGTRIKVALRRKNMFCELRGRRKEQHEWIINHFQMLDKTNLLRKDYVFLPNCWKKENMTDDVEEMKRRVRLMIDLCKLKSADDVTEELSSLLR
jgi:hypothetical protein